MKRPTLAEKRALLENRWPVETRVFDKLVEAMREQGTIDLPMTHGADGIYGIARAEGMPCDVSKILHLIWQCDPDEILNTTPQDMPE